ncbi:heme ABC exporter ATP-binding protein CcmA [Candidatus Kapaibacterium sp.]
MNKINYTVDKLSKAFVRKQFIFRDISMKFANGDVIAITGSNGAGKSTLVKVLCGVLSYNSGTIEIFKDDKECKLEDLKDELALVSPYLNLYEEFTPLEHYKVSASLRGIHFDENKLNDDLNMFNIFKHRNTPIRNFSSGMKQRMKFVLSLQNSPTILFLDEPTSNLDIEGIETVNELIRSHTAQNGIVVIATNEEREKALCNKTVLISN